MSHQKEDERDLLLTELERQQYEEHLRRERTINEREHRTWLLGA